MTIFKKAMTKFKRHFFVCTNKRPPFGRPSCGASGSEEVFEMLKNERDKIHSYWSSGPRNTVDA